MKCVVLHHFPYNDTTQMVVLLTEEQGRITLSAPLSKQKKGAVRKTLFQPLSLLEIETSTSFSKTIIRPKEARLLYVPVQIPFDPVKSSIVLYVAELLYRTLREGDESAALYELLEGFIHLLDLTEESVANFPLLFAYLYCDIQGIKPHTESWLPGSCFDLKEGLFAATLPAHPFVLDSSTSESLAALDRYTFATANEIKVPTHLRKELLNGLTSYILYHTSSKTEIKSLGVLHTLFAE